MDRGYLGIAFSFPGEKNSLSIAVIDPGSDGRGTLYRLYIHGGEGENQNAYDCDGNQLFHLNTLHIYALFALKRFASVDGMIIHRCA